MGCFTCFLYNPWNHSALYDGCSCDGSKSTAVFSEKRRQMRPWIFCKLPEPQLSVPNRSHPKLLGDLAIPHPPQHNQLDPRLLTATERCTTKNSAHIYTWMNVYVYDRVPRPHVSELCVYVCVCVCVCVYLYLYICACAPQEMDEAPACSTKTVKDRR